MENKMLNWFKKINWLQILAGLFWRIVFIPTIFVIVIITLVCVFLNLFIWLVSGKSYLCDIENKAFNIGDYIWDKTFYN